jgi:hypothetical protein
MHFAGLPSVPLLSGQYASLRLRSGTGPCCPRSYLVLATARLLSLCETRCGCTSVRATDDPI